MVVYIDMISLIWSYVGIYIYIYICVYVILYNDDINNNQSLW